MTRGLQNKWPGGQGTAQPFFILLLLPPVYTGDTQSEAGGPARLPAQVAGGMGTHKLKQGIFREKNIFYRAEKSSQGRINFSCTGMTSPTNQPQKGPLSFVL
jgi:hypothetical protein